MKFYIGILATVFLALTSCIENNLPYPVVKIDVLSVKGESFTLSEGDIDLPNRVVTISLDETIDITKVQITEVQITEGGKTSAPLTGTFDLTTPFYFTLSLYQDYEWMIRAKQEISRAFKVEGQIGETVFDLANHRATAMVSKEADLTAIHVEELKLGPRDITTMDLTAEQLTDFSSVRYVDIAYHNVSERWQLYVVPTDISVQFTKADAWAKVAWLAAAGQSSDGVGFRYRAAGVEEWTEVPQEQVTIDGGSFSAKVTGLTPETAYEFIAYAGADQTPVTALTTERMQSLTNGGLEEWSTVNKIIYPYANVESAYWGTGNPGASVAGATLTMSTDKIRPNSSGKLAAQLSSQYANVVGIGKFAAGNLFLGSYVKNDGTNGIVDFGRPFTARPTALRGWVKYTCGTIDKLSKLPPGADVKVGDPDNGMIFVALGNWDPATYGGTAESPLQIRTREIETTFFNPNSPAVIAYGERVMPKSIEEWEEFTIDLKYNATNRIPTHIILVCSASRWGDYFTGSTQSIMWLDDFELLFE